MSDSEQQQQLPSDPDFVRGLDVRRQVLGDEQVEGSIARLTSFNRPFFDYLTRSVWGQVWSREALDRRTRSCITLGILTALGREDEVALHTEVALRNGLTREEIAEVLLHAAVYAGVPHARGAMLAAERRLESLVPDGVTGTDPTGTDPTGTDAARPSP